MDSYSFAAPARVRALLVPLGNTSHDEFQRCSELLRASNEVRLVDITGTKSRMFNPQAFPQGRIIYDFQLTQSDTETLFLQDFEPYRKHFIVIGLATAEVTPNHMEELRRTYKSILVHTAISFDSESTKVPDVFNYPEINMETTMCEISRLFLQELTEYHHSFQYLTLRSPGSMSGSDPQRFISKQKRISSGLNLSDPSLSKLSLSNTNESRVRGRQLKILGNLYLLAGNYQAALTQFHEAIILHKGCYDYLWLGSALEGIAVTILMHSYVDSSFELNPTLTKILRQQQQQQKLTVDPNISLDNPTPITSPRSSVSSFIGGNVEALMSSSTQDLIYQIMTKVIDYFEKSRNDADDYVPNEVYCDTLLRFLKFMTLLYLSENLMGGQLFDNVIHGKKINPSSTITCQSQIFERGNILKLSNKLFQIKFQSLGLLSQVKIYSALSTIYQDLSYERKRAFIIRSLILRLIPELSESNSSVNDVNSLLNSLLSIYGVNWNPHPKPQWIKVHKSIIQLCSSLCDKIGEWRGSVLLKSLLLAKYLSSLTDNEQLTILSGLRGLLKDNPNAEALFFDPFIIRGLKLLNVSCQLQKEIVPNSDGKLRRDPFIYNPYAVKPKETEIPVLVQGEISELVITVQNPFAFTLDINDIKISGFEVLKKNFSIPGKRLQNIQIPVRPIVTGINDIDYINLKILEYSPHNFYIIRSLKPDILRKLKVDQHDKQGGVLFDFKENLSKHIITEKAELDSLKVNIVQSQPSLQLISSVDTIMLLEGGKTSLTLKLQNTTNVPINFLKFSNWDSTEGPLKIALEDKSLTMNEINEVEYFLLKSSITVSKEITEIKAFEEVDLELEILGKRGLNKINFIIDYGNKVENALEVYSKRLVIQLPLSVTNCIELASCDVIPLNNSENSFPELKKWKSISGNDDVLFIIDLRNISNKSIEIEIELFSYKVNITIIPLETKRCVLPIKRFRLNKEKELLKIPSLLNKQYKVAPTTKAQDTFLRKVFWYRQEILNNIKGTWKVEDETGNVEFRGMRITQKMLNLLSLDDVVVEVFMSGAPHVVSGHFRCISTEAFFTVNVKVTNNSTTPIKGILRSVPVSLTHGSIEKRLLYNGVLQQVVPHEILAGKAYEFQVGCVALETGDYEFGAIFDVFESDAQYVSKCPLRLRVQPS